MSDLSVGCISQHNFPNLLRLIRSFASNRRIKCDEGKPACIQCLSSHRLCEGLGYNGSMPTTPARAAMMLTLQPDASVHPAGIRVCPNDLRLFQIFRARTAGQMAGGIDRAFWNRDLLQAIHVHPALWHASLAMAAMHKTLPPPTRATQPKKVEEGDDVLMLKHHYASVKCVLGATAQREALSYAQKEMILMTTILLTTVCSLSGHLAEAFIHARNGLRLFYQWNFWQYMTRHGTGVSQHGVLRSDSLTLLMEFLEYQIVVFTAKTEWPANLPDAAAAARAPPASYAPFTSLTDAYFELLLLMNHSTSAWVATRGACFAASLSSPSPPQGPLPDRRLACRNALARWRSRFWPLQQSVTRTRADVNILWRLELYCAGIELTMCAESSEPGFSILPADATIARMLALVEKVLASEADTANDHELTRSPFFSFSLSIGSQLGLIAVLSRKRAIRQRMVSLLRQWPLTESIWRGAFIAAMAEGVHQVENDGLKPEQQLYCDVPCVDGEYVCFQHRVVSAFVAINKDGLLELRIQSVSCAQQGLPEQKFILNV